MHSINSNKVVWSITKSYNRELLRKRPYKEIPIKPNWMGCAATSMSLVDMLSKVFFSLNFSLLHHLLESV